MKPTSGGDQPQGEALPEMAQKMDGGEDRPTLRHGRLTCCPEMYR